MDHFSLFRIFCLFLKLLNNFSNKNFLLNFLLLSENIKGAVKINNALVDRSQHSL